MTADFSLTMDEFSRPGLSVGNSWYTFEASGLFVITQLPNRNWYFLKVKCVSRFRIIGGGALGFSKVGFVMIVKVALDWGVGMQD